MSNGTPLTTADGTFTHLIGNRCVLRPVIPDDIGLLYRWETGSPLAFRWRLAGQHLSPQAYAESIWSGVLAQFIIVANSHPIGIATGYGADFRHQFCYLAMARFDEHEERTNIGAAHLSVEAFTLLLNYLFNGWDFRKIYMDVPGYNLDQFSSLIGRLCTEEACLIAHLYLGGRYWNLHTLAITRETWNEFRTKHWNSLRLH